MMIGTGSTAATGNANLKTGLSAQETVLESRPALRFAALKLQEEQPSETSTFQIYGTTIAMTETI